MQVIEAVADILKKEGIETLFCYPTTPVIEACAAAGIRPILCRQERVGVDMANGHARVRNGKPPSVFAMQYGPGVENAFSGIATAFSDSTPILLLPLGHYQSTAQLFQMFSATRGLERVTKSAELLIKPADISAVMRRAFAQLRNGRLGPVAVELPRDIAEAQIDDELAAYRPVRTTVSAPNDHDIDEAARMLIEARLPMIQAGQGVLYSEASAELVELAELLDIPVMTTINGKSGFPEDHDLSLGAGGIVVTGHARHFITNSDVLFGIGTSFTPHNLESPPVPKGKRIIHATSDSRDLYKGYDIELPIVGDAKLVLSRLIEAAKQRLGKKTVDGARRRQAVQIRDRWLGEWEHKLASSDKPITPYRVVREFMKTVDPAEAIVTHDAGSPRDQLTPFYKATRPRGYLGWGKSHALGTGMGLTIGAKLADPSKFCVNFMGDAAFGMTGLDFETAARVSAPILTVVFNNSTMAIETKSMMLSHQKYRTRDIGGNYAGLAADLGGWSERVEDPGEIAAALARARRQTQEGRPALLEFITNEEKDFSFRGNTSEKKA
ncbi:thiamine pyrophosphate-requiring protein [Xenophilus azovorans]|uniref:thiamine pyrophosphate-requiring protein n=1 Tax=Xenophilus azovorans TaxID=151755 RepID=UPI00056E3648|nr:thiamine pyrophosphate-requiring protein [Xenophilus azovorans]